ncbi:GPW/gp25 family protein [soil metagenome]
MSSFVKGLRHPLAIDGGAGTVAIERNYPAYVDQLVKQVLLTAPGERVNLPDFGCGLRRMIFAPASVATSQLLQVMIFESLTKWLGDILRVDSIEVKTVDSTLVVDLVYMIFVRGERRYLTLEVTA